MILQYLDNEYKDKMIRSIDSPDVFIDDDIKNYISSLNKLQNVCTTQCCQGHPDNGYLSIMVTKNVSELLEYDIIKNLLPMCEDIVKKFEQIEENKIIIRYLFMFKSEYRDLFFQTLIKSLSQH